MNTAPQHCRQPQVCSSPGFTLIEILVALAILSILFSTVFAVFSRIAQTADLVQQESYLNQLGGMLWTQLNSDLENAYLGQKDNTEEQNASSWSEFTGNNPVPDSPEETALLSFSTYSALDFSTPGKRSDKIVRVRYLIQPLPDHLFQLTREETPFPELDHPPAAHSIVLSQNLTSISVRFFSSTGRELLVWNRDALPPQDKKSRLKRLVISFTLEKKGKKKTFFLARTF